MKSRITLNLSAFLVIFLLLNCSGNKAAVEKLPVTEVKPSWVTQRPIDGNYYTGIAVASKTAHPTTFAQVAQRNALAELASEIEVKVQSNSMLFSFEQQNQFSDEFKEFIQVEANQHIENYEQVATYENATEYWVYYRLLKTQFEKDKNERINQAVNKSVSILELANKAWSSGQYKNGMRLFFDALKPIEPYLGEPLNVTLNGTKDVFLGNYIYTQITQGVRAFGIAPIQNVIKTAWGGAVSNEQLAFNVVDYDGNPIAQIPVNFTYSEGIIRPRNGVSTNTGSVSTEIKKISSTENSQRVTAQIDFKKLVLDHEKPDEIFAKIFDHVEAQKTVVSINVSAPLIYVTAKEKAFGKAKSAELADTFKNQASIQGFGITNRKKDADLFVTITTDTKKAGQSYDLMNVLLNGSVVIINSSTKRVVYQDQFTNIKGVSTTFAKASQEAYAKANSQITEKVVSRFYRNYLK